MRCDEAREHLSETRYGVALRDDVREHVAGCEGCRAVAAGQDTLDALLEQDEPALPGPDFDARFFARLSLERARARRQRWTRVGFAVIPIAAAVALVVLRARKPEAALEAPPAPVLAAGVELLAEDADLALDLELVEDIDVVQRMDELEAFELLATVEESELDALLEETP